MHVTIDGHADSVQLLSRPAVSLHQHNEVGHLDGPRMDKGNLHAQFFACWVHPDSNRSYADHTYKLLDQLHELCRSHPDHFCIARTADRIRENRSENIRSIIPCVEGGHAIENKRYHLRTFSRLGVRYLTLTWMNDNEWADGSGAARDGSGKGLTARGREIVREMNDLGMLVDVSHASERTFWDAVDCSRAPVIASHSCCDALNPHHRNLSDAQLEAVADTGGVIGICFYSAYLDETYARRLRFYRETQNEDWLCALPEDQRPDVPLERLVDHVEHAVKVAGVRHVGLGSDFDGADAFAGNIESCADLPLLREELADRGWNEADLNRIFGENYLRALKVSERAAAGDRNTS